MIYLGYGGMIKMSIYKRFVKNIIGEEEDHWEYCDECGGKGCAGCEGQGKWLKMPK